MIKRICKLAAGFNFVAAQAFFGFYLFGLYPLDRAVLNKLDFVGRVHGVFSRVIMALRTGLANQADNLALLTFFRHSLKIITDKN